VFGRSSLIGLHSEEMAAPSKQVDRRCPLVRRPIRPLFWLLANLGARVRSTPRVAKGLTTVALPDPEEIRVPTRHGVVRAVVQRPSRATTDGSAPPVMVHLHGGGLMNRFPEQDAHIARYVAARLGAVVVLPDYSTAPRVRYPVAEEQAVDLVRWVADHGEPNGWDGSRILLWGISVGGKLAINVCQQLHRAGADRPLAVSLLVPLTDATRTDRTSSIPRPAISPFVQRLVGWAYFPDEDRRREHLASPRFDPTLPAAMPPTLVQVATDDTLAAEGEELARVLTAGDVETVLLSYPGADHGFYAEEPSRRVEQVLAAIVEFCRARLATATPET
jgi:acetyl esterase